MVDRRRHLEAPLGVIAQVTRKRETDFALLIDCIEPNRADREFFIRKAIGWVLREMSKKRPQEVYEWIAPRAHRASGVTMREVVRYLEPNQAERLMRAYKARGPVGGRLRQIR